MTPTKSIRNWSHRENRVEKQKQCEKNSISHEFNLSLGLRSHTFFFFFFLAFLTYCYLSFAIILHVDTRVAGCYFLITADATSHIYIVHVFLNSLLCDFFLHSFAFVFGVCMCCCLVCVWCRLVPLERKKEDGKDHLLAKMGSFKHKTHLKQGIHTYYSSSLQEHSVSKREKERRS